MSPPDPHARLRAIQHSITGFAGEFACGGSVPFTEPVTFRVRDQRAIVMRPARSDFIRDVVEGERIRETAAKKLRKLCNPAPFGDGGKTVIDPRVRKAWQLDAAGGAFTLEGFDPERSGVLAEVRARLAPMDPNPIAAELYALNVYDMRGHFVPHKDTPRGDDMLGTLVVCLPVQYGGGALCVSHRGVERRFFERRAYHPRPPAETLEWAAFFGDVDHEVAYVSSGIRVTVTWILRRTAGARPAAPEPGTTRDRVARALREAVADETFFPGGARLGVPCEHMYRRSVNAPVVMQPLTAETALALAGRDQAVALAAIDAGLEVQLLPLLTETSAEQVWTLTRFLTEKEAALFRRQRVTYTDIEDRLPAKGPHDGVDEVIDAWVMPEPRLEFARAERPFPGAPAVGYLGGPEYSATGYFGNEGSPTEFYAYAALVITVPKRTKGR